MKSENPVLNKIYNLSSDPDECVDAYKGWAKTYDQDTVEGMNYVGPHVAAERLAGLVKPDSVILDAGCGTGLAGEELASFGQTVVDGMDISPDMLEQARKKGVYRALEVQDMTKPLSYEDDAYDGVICVGTFTHAHVGPKGFDELVRITRPGGPIVATVHEDVWPDGYEDHFKTLERSGRARLLSISEEDYHVHKCKLVTLQVL